MLLLSLTSFSASADSLYIDPFGIAPGSEKEVEVKINTTGEYIGFQTEITLPAGLSFVKTASGQYASLPSGDTSHQVVGNLSGQTLKVIGYFTTLDSPLYYQDGSPVIIIKVKAAESFTKSSTIRISNPIFSKFSNTGQEEVTGDDSTCEVSILPSSINLTPPSVELKDGEKMQLTAALVPTGAVGSITWSSSDETKATVSSTGLVTAKSVTGEVTITASCGDIKSTCNVTVIPTPATSVTLDKTEATLKATETVQLTATILPETTTDKSVKWTTSDAAIATVDANGKVTAVAVGTANITATAASGISASCKITVVETPAASVTIDKTAMGITGDNLQMHVGDTKAIKVTVAPETTTDKSVTYTSSNPSVASVDGKGTITALAVGETTITITAKSGVRTTITVKVVATEVTSVSLNKTTLTLKATESETLVATVFPEDATDKTVAWTTSDASVATVDANGKVSAVKVGNATITATAGG